MRLFYSPEYVLATAEFDTTRKAAWVAASLLERPVPGVELGVPTDYRVPDAAAFRERTDRVWNHTAAIVVEVVSPGDDTRRKFGFYFRVGVEEVLIVDPDERTVEWLARGDGAFVPVAGSALWGLTSAEVAARIDWPASSGDPPSAC